MRILPEKEFKRFVYEGGISAGLTPEQAALEATNLEGVTTPEGEIVIQEGSDTHLKLHEVGHKVLGSPKIITSTGEETVGDVAYSEILAEKFAWEAKGKPLTYRIGLPAIRTLNYSQGLSTKASVEVVIQVLTKYMGIPVTREDRKFILHWAKRNLLGRKGYYTKY